MTWAQKEVRLAGKGFLDLRPETPLTLVAHLIRREILVFLEAPEEGFLLLGEILGSPDPHSHELVAASAAVEPG
jgi:hypothetical protein